MKNLTFVRSCENCEQRCEDIAYYAGDSKYLLERQVACPNHNMRNRGTEELTRIEFAEIVRSARKGE